MTIVPPIEILAHLRNRQSEIVDFLSALVLAESPSTEPTSQKAVHRLIAEELTTCGFLPKQIPGRETGGMLYATPHDRPTGNGFQLLLGHSDTVWPLGTLGEMPLEIDDVAIRGPGVHDMKGGLAQMVFALKALHDLEQTFDLSPVILINSDEEIGSLESTRHIRRLGARAERVFVLEPSLGLTGKLKTSRKGLGRFRVTIVGKSAHGGLEPEAGVSAVVELSHVIQALHAMNDPKLGITVNVGKIEGGIRPNVVAAESRAWVDVRIRDPEDGPRMEQAIHSLEPTTPGIKLFIEGHFRRPPLRPTQRNRALWERAHSLGQELGLELEEGLAGGASDGNTTSQHTATLDGLGSVGDGAHARHEFVYTAKLAERAALLALLMRQSPSEHAAERGST